MSRPSVEYRQDAHVASLSVWTLLCAGTATVLFIHSDRLLSRPLQIAEILGGFALLVLGPMALAVYLYRSRHVWVSVDRERGIRVGEKGFIAWQDIERIERRCPRLRSKAGPAEIPSLGDLTGKNSWCADVFLCMTQSGPLVLAFFLVLLALPFFWAIFVVFIPLVIVPVVEVFAPLGDRLVITVREGRPLLLRDLRNADGFLTEVRGRLPVVER
jgi:hypothetical protein